MSDEAYTAAVRRVLDDGWNDVEESIRRHMLDVVLAERLCARIRNLLTAERTLADGKMKKS